MVDVNTEGAEVVVDGEIVTEGSVPVDPQPTLVDDIATKVGAMVRREVAMAPEVASWEQAADRAIVARKERERIIREVLVEDVDYGEIPGCGPKKVLFKSGAEKISDALQLWTDFELLPGSIEDWDRNLFHYRYKCRLRARGSDVIVASAVGSCNSRESKYRWAWVDEQTARRLGHDPSSCLARDTSINEFAFAIDKAETTGKYSKPAEYWQRFQSAIQEKAARRIMRKTATGKELPAWEIPSVAYRVPNEDIASLINTIDKMGQKRAMVGANLFLGFSHEFTQDIEDNPEAYGAQEPAPPMQAPTPENDTPPKKQTKKREPRTPIQTPKAKSETSRPKVEDEVGEDDLKALVALCEENGVAPKRVGWWSEKNLGKKPGRAPMTHGEMEQVRRYVKGGDTTPAQEEMLRKTAESSGCGAEALEAHVSGRYECQLRHLTAGERVAVTEWMLSIEEVEDDEEGDEE